MQETNISTPSPQPTRSSPSTPSPRISPRPPTPPRTGHERTKLAELRSDLIPAGRLTFLLDVRNPFGCA